ncbi:UNVERIFIED_CONTAM: hypothetical protein PYX00_006828 [Menopon gallinae]|uniref:Small ribosomal subunit protein mS38 n=1 Tax=Menopon gallinae TaxID=328185 RepID=A0AAW2HX82_9NEOP
MNFGNQFRKLLKFNVISYFSNTRKLSLDGGSIKFFTPSLNIYENEVKSTTQFHLLPSLTSSSSSSSSSSVMTPDLSIKDSRIRNIISEPSTITDMNVGLPVSNLNINNFQLPSIFEREMIDPHGQVMEKKALNMIRIRHKKIKKHKRKKLLKRMKFHYRRLKRKRAAIKEQKLLKEITNTLEEGERYNPDQELNEHMQILNWTPPMTRVRGFLAPQEVIEKELERLRNKKLLDERIAVCLKKM